LVPLGKLTLVAGDGGQGKSTISLDITGAVTSGRTCCGLTYDPPPPADVLLISCEDDAADTVVPRLLSAGADLKRCHSVQGIVTAKGGRAPFSLDHIHALRGELTHRPEVRLVVIDPVSAFVGRAKVDDHKDSQLRALLSGLTEVAAEHDIAIVLIAHLNKAQGVKAVCRVLASVGYVNASRSVLMVIPDPDDKDRRLLLPVKANLTPERKGLAYRAAPMTPEEQARVLAGRVDHLSQEDRDRLAGQLFRVEWCGQVEATADEALAATTKQERGPNKVERCAAWLKELLATYAYPSDEILARAKTEGFTFDNLQEAKKRLKADGLRHSNRGRFQGSWWSGFGDPRDWQLRPEGQSGGSNTPYPHTPQTPYSPQYDHTKETKETKESKESKKSKDMGIRGQESPQTLPPHPRTPRSCSIGTSTAVPIEPERRTPPSPGETEAPPNSDTPAKKKRIVL
jgi:hypothetical protein